MGSQVEEVNFFKEDGTVLHFASPVRVQGNPPANTYVVSGNGVTKQLNELMPGIIAQMGPDSLQNLKALAEAMKANTAGEPGSDVADFEAVAKGEEKGDDAHLHSLRMTLLQPLLRTK